MIRLRAFILGFALTGIATIVLIAYMLGIMWLHDHDYRLFSALMSFFGICTLSGLLAAWAGVKND